MIITLHDGGDERIEAEIRPSTTKAGLHIVALRQRDLVDDDWMTTPLTTFIAGTVAVRSWRNALATYLEDNQ